MNKKNIYLLFFCLLFSVLTTLAQPSQIQDVGKSVFSLTTFKADGSILASSHGFFINENGEAVSDWTPFVNAAKAVIVDANGQKMDVVAMIGVNELYDICKFRVNCKPEVAPLATSPATANEKVWLVNYSVKKAKCKQYSVKSVETFMEKYNYYIFSDKIQENAQGCPMVNGKGQVIGILQIAKTKDEFHATDAAFTNTFVINGLTINTPALRQTSIPVALPEKEDEALLTLMMASNKGDSVLYTRYIEDFIRQFPKSAEGYMARAQNAVRSLQFDTADKDMLLAIDNAEKKDAAHSNYSRLIFEKEVYYPNAEYPNWNFQKSLDEAKKAYEINPLPIYLHQQAQIIYTMGDYQTAYDMFMGLTKTDLRNGELFYEAAQCKSHLQASNDELIVLLDSAINVSEEVNTNNAAPYYLARGRIYDTTGEYRKAVADYNKYDTLMYGRGSHEFYYLKFKCESKIRQYKQALNDIAHAIVLNQKEPTYYAEMASLQLKVNQLEDAITTSDMCIKIDSSYSDPYIIKGIALAELKRNEEAATALKKAKELGDDRADELLKKYKLE